jgi:asparagine synthase (glutamine-hydrolysing)
MCGIAGWIDFQRDLTQALEVLEQMSETLQFRGPDAKGTWLTTHCGLVHRRLSVIDPANGAQPMIRQHAGNTYVLVYNGEVYNADELRKALQCRGYLFSTHCDTEVVLFATIEWGEQAAERLNGIFAYACWDVNRQRLLLVRDRLGVKPLFYAEIAGGRLLFGSEPKAIVAHPAFKPVVDRDGFAELFVIGPARTPGHGVFRDLRELRPGHRLVVDRDGMRASCYWRLEAKPHEHDLPQTVQAVRALLVDTVQRQLVSDVPIGTLLSGGLDSSALSAIAQATLQQQGRGTLHTFSVDYVDQAQHFAANAFQPSADRPWIELMSETLQSSHHYMTFDTPDLIDTLHESLLARDLPGMVDIDASLLLFCREIKQHITVALSGEAADEVFGGYPWFFDDSSDAARTFPWSKQRLARLDHLSDETRDWLQAEAYLAQRYEEARAEVPVLPGGEPLPDQRHRELAYLNISRFMPTLLDRKDRMSMRTGLEVRVPFCDHRLVEYVFNVPWAFKTAGNREKGLLRLAVEPFLPEAIVTRKKSPYPKTHNPSYFQTLRERLSDTLSNANSPLLPFVNRDALHKLAHSNDVYPWFGQLMAAPQLFAYLLQIDDWLRTYRIQIG